VNDVTPKEEMQQKQKLEQQIKKGKIL